MHDDRILLEKISAGDEQAFRVLFDLHRKKIYSYALKIVKCEIQAEDILQDVFLKIWQHQDLTVIEDFDAYLKVMTRNHVFKILRRRQLEIQTNNGLNWTEAHNETEESLLLNDTMHLLKQGVSQLPPQQKLVYNLCREQGLKYEAAAKLLAISPLTVKTHMQHSLRFLRKYLSKYTDIAKLWLAIQCLWELNK